MADIQSAAAEIRRGIKKKKEERKKSQGINIMACPFHTAPITKVITNCNNIHVAHHEEMYIVKK